MNMTSQQRGFTLIELMIALVISSVMISVAVSQLMQSRKTYYVQEAEARLEENARYALEIIRDNVKIAGYVDTSVGIPDVPLGQFYNGDCGGAFATCTDDGDDDLGESDHFAVWLNPSLNDDGQELGCSGVDIGAAAYNNTIVNLFYIQTDNNINSLKCRTYTIDASDNSATLVAGSDQPLIEGIDRMQVLYGLADQSPSDPRPERYVSAATINALGTPAVGSGLKQPWASVSSIRIVLLAGTGYDDGADLIDSRTFALGDAEPFTPQDANGAYDYNRRKVFSSTMVINNANL